MFKRLLARLFGGQRLERIEAEEAFEHEFGYPPLRTMSTQNIKRQLERRQKPMAVRNAHIRSRYAGNKLRDDDVLNNPLHPASPLNPIYHQPVTSSRSHSSWEDDSSSRHHGGHDSHHSSSSYDSGSSDSGSSSSCD